MKGIRCQSRQTGSPFRIRNGLPRHNGTVGSLSEYSTTARSALPNGNSPPSYEQPKTTDGQSGAGLSRGLGKVVETDFDDGNQAPKSPDRPVRVYNCL